MFDLEPVTCTFLDGERATVDLVFRWRIASPLIATQAADVTLSLETTVTAALSASAARIRLSDVLANTAVLVQAVMAQVRHAFALYLMLRHLR